VVEDSPFAANAEAVARAMADVVRLLRERCRRMRATEIKQLLSAAGATTQGRAVDAALQVAVRDGVLTYEKGRGGFGLPRSQPTEGGEE
jgi:DsbC/DsbD-like thiol-disulfide interchange protein